MLTKYYIKDSLVFGATKVCFPSPTAFNDPNKKLEKAALEFYNSLQKKRCSPGYRDVLVFRGMRAFYREFGEISPADYVYWKEKGWLNPNARYFVDVPINPFYNTIGWVFEQILKIKNRKYVTEVQRLTLS